LRRIAAAAITLLLVVGCSSSAPSTSDGVRPPPVDQSAVAVWTYAAYLLGRGDAAHARTYLDAIAGTDLGDVSDPSLFFRDLAEACLFSGDTACAAQAAAQARDAVARKSATAQFRDGDRRVFERTVDALGAAATGDAGQLQRLAEDDQSAPSADAWYLLGWLDEGRGDVAEAQTAYRRYLRLAPEWSFLREAGQMRQHAESVAG
jgi:hypothetical protein